jgi:ABC-type sugar transport system, periplasmic component
MRITRNPLRRTVAAIAIAAAATLTIAGCTSGEAADGGGSDESLSMAFLTWNTQAPFIATMVAGAEARADELGIDLTVGNSNQDNAVQISQIQDAIAKDVDAIILHAGDAAGVLPAVEQAQAAGIPVIAVNSALDTDVAAFVGADHKEMGVGSAELVKEALPDGGTVALVAGITGNPVSEARGAGLKEGLADAPEYEIVAEVTDDFTTEGNIAAVQDLLTRFPAGELGAIVAQGGQLYAGAEYAASIGRDDVAFIANDYPIQVKSSIEAGQIFGTVLQDPGIQGEESVQAAFDIVTWRRRPRDDDDRASPGDDRERGRVRHELDHLNPCRGRRRSRPRHDLSSNDTAVRQEGNDHGAADDAPASNSRCGQVVRPRDRSPRHRSLDR